jgi:hypothetical protein
VAVAQGLRRRSAEVTTTSETGLTSADDEAQMAFALRERRVLVTQDADFIRLHQRGMQHAGIAYFGPGMRTVGQLITQLVLIEEVLTPEEMDGQVEFL